MPSAWRRARALAVASVKGRALGVLWQLFVAQITTSGGLVEAGALRFAPGAASPAFHVPLQLRNGSGKPRGAGLAAQHRAQQPRALEGLGPWSTPTQGDPTHTPRGLQHTPASPPQLGASPLRLWDLPRSSSRGAAQRRGRLARPLKRQQILLSAHSSRSVKSQSVHQQLSVVCRLQPRAASAPVRAGGVSRSPRMRPSRSQPTDKPGGDTVPLNAA